ncbi:hypothetical protein ACQEVF_57090 [Nonomuraea polychroma]|uniref:hypothetical protein n=1 Tax=Nonomuraea polychroma TaxID=46176 RepID=UPI003D947134
MVLEKGEGVQTLLSLAEQETQQKLSGYFVEQARLFTQVYRDTIPYKAALILDEMILENALLCCDWTCGEAGFLAGLWSVQTTTSLLAQVKNLVANPRASARRSIHRLHADGHCHVLTFTSSFEYGGRSRNALISFVR